jgi:hypothetical protein
MEMPKPGRGHVKLESFAGNWSGEEKMYPSQWDPKGGVAQGTMNSKVACDGFYVVGDYEQKRDGVVTYRGHSVTGYDPNTQEVVMHWFDSIGMGAEEFRGKFQGDTLTLLSKGPMGHNRLTYDLREKGTLRSKMEMSQDGKQWSAMFDGVYHKRA